MTPPTTEVSAVRDRTNLQPSFFNTRLTVLSAMLLAVVYFTPTTDISPGIPSSAAVISYGPVILALRLTVLLRRVGSGQKAAQNPQHMLPFKAGARESIVDLSEETRNLVFAYIPAVAIRFVRCFKRADQRRMSPGCDKKEPVPLLHNGVSIGIRRSTAYADGRVAHHGPRYHYYRFQQLSRSFDRRPSQQMEDPIRAGTGAIDNKPSANRKLRPRKRILDSYA